MFGSRRSSAISHLMALAIQKRDSGSGNLHNRILSFFSEMRVGPLPHRHLNLRKPNFVGSLYIPFSGF